MQTGAVFDVVARPWGSATRMVRPCHSELCRSEPIVVRASTDDNHFQLDLRKLIGLVMDPATGLRASRLGFRKMNMSTDLLKRRPEQPLGCAGSPVGTALQLSGSWKGTPKMAAEPHPTSEVSQAERLVAGYDRKTTFCFTSPTRVLFARGPYTELNQYRGGTTSELLTALSERGLSDAAIVGAVPFERELAARLLLPSRLIVGPPLTTAQHLPRAALSTRRKLSPARDEERRHFCAAVKTALHDIRSGEVAKVVLSRILDIRASGMTEVPAVVRRLLLQNAGSYGFAIQLRERAGHAGDNAVFFGASPELVLAKQGTAIASHPLAGSMARSSDPVEDRQRAQQLLESEKDSREHAYVVQDIAARLGPECRRLRVPRQPELVATPTMWHLGTRLEGELLDGRRSSLELALLIHPTPAVCGAPRQAAQALIADLERRPRGLYTGLVGWCNARGDGEWALTIRCARAHEDGYRLYAGAGIVEGSDPSQEWRETEAKLATLLDALELPAPSQVET